jgi:diaminopimelate decarboxylase
MAIDVVRENVDLPPLEAGDLLTLHPVGAYNSNQAMQFIHYRPASVMVGTDGVPMLIKERETLEALVQGEHLPERLRRG